MAEASKGLVTYLAICPNYWGKGPREKDAIREMNKARGSLTKVRTGMYRFVGEGHERAYVNEMGGIAYPKGVQYEVVYMDEKP